MSERESHTGPTPPPWEVWGDGEYVRWAECRNRAGKRTHCVVASVSSPGENELRTITGAYGSYETATAIRKANARLIAAAPELLAALKEVLRISDRKHDAWDAARAAIAKAEGGAP